MVEYQQQPVRTASAVNLLKVRQSLQADHTESWLSDQLWHQREKERETTHGSDDYRTLEALYCVGGGLLQPTLVLLALISVEINDGHGGVLGTERSF